MARAPDPRIEEAKAMYLEGRKLIEIAEDLGLPEGTVRSWKNRYKWDCNVANGECNVAKAKAKRNKAPSRGTRTAPAVRLGIRRLKNTVSSRSTFRKRPFQLLRGCPPIR